MKDHSYGRRHGVRRGALAATVFASLLVPGLAATASQAAGAPTGSPAAPGPARLSAAAGKSTGPAHQLDPKSARLMRQQEALLPVARAYQEASARAGSDIAGVSIDVAAGRVDVYRTAVSAAAPAQLRVPAQVRVVTHAAKYNRAQLAAAAAKVKAGARTLAGRGVRVAAVSARFDGSGLDLTLLGTTAKAVGAPAAASLSTSRSLLTATAGAAVTSVRTAVDSGRLVKPYYAGWRFNDFSPWYGGDRIAEGCTTGFPALSGGVMKMMTAAHCGGSGTVFHNGPNNSGGSSTLGAVTYWNDSTDIAVIDVASSVNRINVGPAQNSSTAPVTSWESPVVGEYVCQSGSYSGEVCSLYVVDTNQSTCISWILWWCTKYLGPMADAINAYGSGYYAAGHGDSGAPVYWWDSAGYVHPVGQVHGQLFPNAQAAYPAYVPDTMWCPAPEGWMQRCSSGFSFAHMPGK